MSRLHHITRVDPPTGRGYWVRIQRNGRVLQRWFPVWSYGSRKAALDAARHWRDRKLARHPSRAPKARVWRDGHTWRGQVCRNGQVFRIERSARVHGAKRAEQLVRAAVRRRAP